MIVFSVRNTKFRISTKYSQNLKKNFEFNRRIQTIQIIDLLYVKQQRDFLVFMQFSWNKVKQLYTYGCRLTHIDLLKANFKQMQNLEEIDFDNSILTYIAITNFNSAVIKSLSLIKNCIGDKGMLAFSKQNWRQLQHLDVSNNGLTNYSITLLSKVELPYLYILNISYNKITDQGLKVLVKYSLPNLCDLNLECIPIGDYGMKVLAQHCFTQLCCWKVLDYYQKRDVSPPFQISIGGMKQFVKSYVYYNLVDNLFLPASEYEQLYQPLIKNTKLHSMVKLHHDILQNYYH